MADLPKKSNQLTNPLDRKSCSSWLCEETLLASLSSQKKESVIRVRILDVTFYVYFVLVS